MHLLNNGRQLVAAVIHPGSQSGLQALTVLDIETGEAVVFEDVFSAMVADIRYPDNRTVAAVALNHVTVIDAQTKAKTVLPFSVEAVTADFGTCFRLTQGKGEDGDAVGALEMFTADQPDAACEMLTYHGQNARLCGVVEHYALLLCKDSEDEYIAIVSTRPPNAPPLTEGPR